MSARILTTTEFASYDGHMSVTGHAPVHAMRADGRGLNIYQFVCCDRYAYARYYAREWIKRGYSVDALWSKLTDEFGMGSESACTLIAQSH